MPAKTPRTPSYRRHKATGQAVVTLNGRDHYLGRHGTRASRERFDALIAEWLAGGRRLPAVGGEALTVAELAAAYWRHAKECYQKDGHATGELGKVRVALRVLRRMHSRTPASAVGPLSLKAVREQFVSSGIGRKYINDQVRRIQRMFRWAVENEFIPSGVLHGLQAVSGLRTGRTSAPDPQPVRPVPQEYVDAVLPFVSKQVAAMIRLQSFCGARPGEITIMRACDLDVGGKVWLYRPSSHKTQHHGHERVIEIGPRAQEVLRPFLKRDVTAYLFSPSDAVTEHRAEKRRKRSSRLTPSQRARRPKKRPMRAPRDHYDRDSYRHAVTRACLAADVPRWHPHQLRHNFATTVRKLHGLEVARILLGHRSAVMTEIYAEADRTKAREIVAKIG